MQYTLWLQWWPRIKIVPAYILLEKGESLWSAFRVDPWIVDNQQTAALPPFGERRDSDSDLFRP